MNNKVNAEQINELLGDKNRVDLQVRRNLIKYALFKDEVEAGEDSEIFGTRVVAAMTRTNANYLLQLSEEQRRVNEELVELAPMYFKSSSVAFKEMEVLRNVTYLHITVNSAVNSQKRTGKQLAGRAKRLAISTQKEIDSRPTHINASALKEKKALYMADFEMFNSQPDRVFRIRTDKHKDVIAMYMCAGMTKFDKVRVTGGGLLVIKHHMASDENFKVINKYYSDRKSIYDDANPIPNNLDFKGNIYDESELELLRKNSVQHRDDNEQKIRPKGQDLIN